MKTKPIFQMTNREIDLLLRKISQKAFTITERINFFSELFLGAEYSTIPTGEGNQALYEAEPLVNTVQINCMTYCENLLALSISDSWDIFFNNLQRIRYRDGIISIFFRNHYTMADWLPQNRWLLEDVSRKIGMDFTQSVTRTISHRQFFQTKGIDDFPHILPDRTLTIDYIPLKNLDLIEERLQMGDIGALIYLEREDIFAKHMVIIAEKNREKWVRESSISRKTTFETPFSEWVREKQEQKNILGLAFMRVREDLDKKGNILLPWKIRS